MKSKNKYIYKRLNPLSLIYSLHLRLLFYEQERRIKRNITSDGEN